MEQPEEVLRMFIEYAPAPIAMFDNQMRYMLTSRRWLTDYGLEQQSIIGRCHYDFFPDLPQRWLDAHARALAGSVEKHERDEFLRTDGTVDWVRWEIHPWYRQDKQIGGVIMFTELITNLVNYETALHKAEAAEATSRQLEAAAAELAFARDQAVEASHLKSAFVANISHELRTPLAGVIGLNELLLATHLNAEQEELARSVQDAAQSLLIIVNDVLDLSKIEAGKSELEIVPFNVIFLLQDLSRLFAATAARKGLKLGTFVDQHIPPFVMGDPTRTKQILLNLIGNAIKFTEEGEVNVRAVLESQDDDTATIGFSIKDTGIGIAEERSRLLFQPFSQLDSSTTRLHGGTGLGLSISKHFVKMMGGEIGVESEIGKGSTFWFTIPFAKEKNIPSAEARTAVYVEQVPGNKLVLVVEDNTLIQFLTTKQLTNLGVQSHTAATGKQALEAINNCKYDLVLMDCQMPEMNGLEATQAIRMMEAGTKRHQIIIAMTAGAMAGDREKCIRSGMDDFLSKPFTIEELRAMLVLWFAKAESRKSEQA